MTINLTSNSFTKLLIAIALLLCIGADLPDARVDYGITTVTIPVTNFDSQQNQYHTEQDYINLIGKPSMDGVMGTSGQLIVQDHGLTPGAVMTDDPKVVCTRSTKTVRNVPIVEKKAVYDIYSKYYKQVVYRPGNYEVDHLVSLELGGSNSPNNLWPEYYNDPYGAHVKDRLENFLHKQVCSGKMPLKQAQYVIAYDWKNAYQQYFGKKP